MHNIRNTTVLLAALTAAVSASAAVYTWSPSATTALWDTGTNWEGGSKPSSGPANEVVFSSNAGMSSGYGVTYSTSQTLGSLTIDLPQFSLIASATRTLTIGSVSQTGYVNITSAFTTNSNVFTAGTSPRLNIEYVNDIVLKNEGTGLASFANARLQNGTVSSTDGTIRFQGSGSWNFAANSYVGAQQSGGARLKPALKVALILESGADAFTGTLSYAADTAMDVDTIAVNSGTFRLVGKTIGVVDGVSVGAEGWFVGAGTINGDVSVEGNLAVGYNASAGNLMVNGDLALLAGSTTTLRVLDGGLADAITIGGAFDLGGALVVDTFGEWVGPVTLYDGAASITGNFDSVTVGGAVLTASGSQWVGVGNGYLWTFDASSGVLNAASAIPEPGSVALLAGAFVGLTVVTSRRTRSRR